MKSYVFKNVTTECRQRKQQTLIFHQCNAAFTPLSHLFTEAQGQFEQLLDEAQLLAAFIHETQQLTHAEVIRVLPKQRPCLYETPERGAHWQVKNEGIRVHIYTQCFS